MAELVRAENELSDWFLISPLRWNAHEKISLNRVLETF